MISEKQTTWFLFGSTMNEGQTVQPKVEITFTEDWSTVSNSELYPGCLLVLNYNLKRLVPDAPADVSGDFYAEVSFRNKGRPVSKLLTPGDTPKLLTATVDVPLYCRNISVWFKVCKPNGHSQYDSNSGLNYQFPVRGNAIMAFPVNEDFQTRGYLTPGGTLRLCYDSRRLPGRDFYRGEPCWDIQAAARFKEFENDTRKVMQAMSDDVDPIMITEFDIPTDAEFVAVWFKHWGYFSGDTYDTNGGHNYVRSFQYDGELWFKKDMTTSVKGFLLCGSKVCVWFETSRIFQESGLKKKEKSQFSLPTCAKSKWLKLNAMFGNDGNVTAKDFGHVRKESLVKTVLDIPDNASELTLWFTYGDVDADDTNRKEVCFDSCFGKNYHYEVIY